MSTVDGKDIVTIEDIIHEVFNKNNLNKSSLLYWTLDQYEHQDDPTVLLVFNTKASKNIHIPKGLELCQQIKETLKACGFNFHVSFTFRKHSPATNKENTHACQNPEPTPSH